MEVVVVVVILVGVGVAAGLLIYRRREARRYKDELEKRLRDIADDRW